MKNERILLSPRDVKMYDFLEAYIKKNSFAPLHSEIAKGLEIFQSNVNRTLVRLEKLGCLKRYPLKHRGIILIKSPRSL